MQRVVVFLKTTRAQFFFLWAFASLWKNSLLIIRAAILWNTIAFKHPDVTKNKRWTRDSKQSRIHELRDFHFKATSAWTFDLSNDDFIYF